MWITPHNDVAYASATVPPALRPVGPYARSEAQLRSGDAQCPAVEFRDGALRRGRPSICHAFASDLRRSHQAALVAQYAMTPPSRYSASPLPSYATRPNGRPVSFLEALKAIWRCWRPLPKTLREQVSEARLWSNGLRRRSRPAVNTTRRKLKRQRRHHDGRSAAPRGERRRSDRIWRPRSFL
jgi:hypothetical protein